MRNMLLSMARLLSTGVTKVDDLDSLATNFQMVIKTILGPILSIISVAGVIYAIVLGFNYAKAQDASEREKVKGRLIGAVVGAVIMIAGAVLCFAIDWVSIFNSFGGTVKL